MEVQKEIEKVSKLLKKNIIKEASNSILRNEYNLKDHTSWSQFIEEKQRSIKKGKKLS